MGGQIKIDLTEMQKDLRGIVHKYLNEHLQSLNIEDLINKRVIKITKDTLDKLIESKVYKFLEESEIEVPPKNYYHPKKITLNDYIIKIAHDKILEHVNSFLNEKLIIGWKDGKNDKNNS